MVGDGKKEGSREERGWEVGRLGEEREMGRRREEGEIGR
jgi:hypothetical protein